MLGIDAALETEEEELERRTKKMVNDIPIFKRCRMEKRALLTTSTRLLQKKEAPPSAHLINTNNGGSDMEENLAKVRGRSEATSSNEYIKPTYISIVRGTERRHRFLSNTPYLQLLLEDQVKLFPRTFLTICVKCGGKILEIKDQGEIDKAVEDKHAPESAIPLFKCNKIECQSFYWWNEKKASSAGR